MKVCLKPLFGGDYDDIALSGLLLPIGMGDAPFDSYPDDLRLQLAERHARLFLDGDTLYVVDLHSATGTTLNGEPVTDDPLAVSAGDVLCFGHDLRFEAALEVAALEEAALEEAALEEAALEEAALEVAALEEADSASPAAGEDPDAEEGERTEILAAPMPPTLLLLPVRSGNGPSPIAISTFPFLVSKSSGHFATYKQQFAKETSFVSRRHAHIYARGQDLYIEDLGSTNGTLLNGRRLDGTAEKLSADDTLQFGHELFTFKVALEAAPVQDNQAVATRRTVPEGTILVSRAASFLDIYCDTPEPESEMPEPESTPVEEQTPLARLNAMALSVRDRVQKLWQQVPLGKELRIAALSLVVLAVLAVVAGWLLADDRPEEVQALLEAQQYEPALVLAEAYLADNPENESVQRLANQALRGYLVPDWSHAILAGDYQAADGMLNTARAQAASQADASELAVLYWIGELQRYVAGREVSTGVVLVEGEHPIELLLRRWNENSERNLRLLDELAREYPAFDPVRVNALSHLRSLKSDASVLLEAMESLQKKVLRPLDAQAAAAALAALDAFERDYPRVRGADTWRADVQAYLTLKQAHAAGKLTDYLRERDAVGFNTVYFTERVAAEFPPGDELKPLAGQYALADQQWRNGDLTGSLALLDTLAQGDWGGEAKALFEYRQQLLNDFLRLPDLYQSEDYQTALLAFYTRIDAQRDKFMFDALRSDFSDQRDFAEQRAQALLAAGGQSWQDYQAAGGISGALRLESRISERYREQANHLSSAHQSLREAAQIYTLLGAELPASAGSLYAAVVAEAERQRAAIDDLGAVLGAATVAEKSSLLPAAAEEEQP